MVSSSTTSWRQAVVASLLFTSLASASRIRNTRSIDNQAVQLQGEEGAPQLQDLLAELLGGDTAAIEGKGKGKDKEDREGKGKGKGKGKEAKEAKGKGKGKGLEEEPPLAEDGMVTVVIQPTATPSAADVLAAQETGALQEDLAQQDDLAQEGDVVQQHDLAQQDNLDQQENVAQQDAPPQEVAAPYALNVTSDNANATIIDDAALNRTVIGNEMLDYEGKGKGKDDGKGKADREAKNKDEGKGKADHEAKNKDEGKGKADHEGKGKGNDAKGKADHEAKAKADKDKKKADHEAKKKADEAKGKADHEAKGKGAADADAAPGLVAAPELADQAENAGIAEEGNGVGNGKGHKARRMSVRSARFHRHQ